MVGAERQDTVVGIVGAGPAGLVLAHLLHGAGISCIVLERRSLDEIRGHAKAGLIEHRTVRLLDGYGLAGTILTRGVENGTCEFRAGGSGVVVDYGALTGGRAHHIYPQHLLVGDWADMLLAAGGEIRLGTRVTAVEQDEAGAVVHAVDEATGAPLVVACEAVAGCDGSRSVVGPGLSGIREIGRSHRFRWLAVIAEGPPSAPHTIYASHARGFAGQMRRGPTMTRYYLEVPTSDTVDDWPAARVWSELAERFDVEGRPPPAPVPIVEQTTVDLRVRVVEPMQDGRVFLAGDAAHLITPAGGKGMNLAVQDAVELACGLIDRYGPAKDGDRLGAYSATRLPAVWRAQEFSDWMLGLLHAGTTAPDDGTGAGTDAGALPGAESLTEFAHRLRSTRISRLVEDPDYARWFAHAYAGVDRP